MWKFWNKLFGWDYIFWNNTADQGIARVYKDGNNNPYYFQYRVLNLIEPIRKESDVIWLTCKSNKYING